jgi:glycerate-2-kinase
LFDAGVTAAAPEPVTARAVDALAIPRDRRIWLFAFGKAATAMAAGAASSLLRSRHSIAGGVVVSADDASPPYATLAAMRGDHPVPGRHSFATASKIADATAARRGNDASVVLMSGGASSLIGAPLRGMNEADLTYLYELLLGAGLDIATTNAVRKRFTRWGGGRLALALAPGATYCLAISDVAGDDLGVIGSGPCVPDPTTAADVEAALQRAGLTARIPATHRAYLASVARGTIPETPKRTHPAFAHVTARVIANTKTAVDGAAAAARGQSLDVETIAARLTGEASRAGEDIARQLLGAKRRGASGKCFLWGGETTVTLSGAGQKTSGGGRCQELALAAARVLHDAGAEAADIRLLAAGTDGRDGATDAAGAVVDGGTWAAIAAAGRDPAQALAAHESNGALAAAGALLPRRDTGTNVNDVVIAVT